MADGTARVFVYGTLMRGARNAALLDGAALVAADATTAEGRFVMRQFASSSSPGRQTPGVLAGGGGFVRGEIYAVDEAGLAALDRLEQNGVRYRREWAPMSDGGHAWIYLLIAGDAPSDRQDRIGHDPATGVFWWERAEPATD